jgi:hypothetical protein
MENTKNIIVKKIIVYYYTDDGDEGIDEASFSEGDDIIVTYTVDSDGYLHDIKSNGEIIASYNRAGFWLIPIPSKEKK